MKRVRHGLFLFDLPEPFDYFAVGDASRNVKLPSIPELELRVLLHGLDDVGAAPEHDSHDLEGGLVAVDAQNAKGVLAQFVVDALDETVQVVVRLVRQLVFSLALLVVHKVKAESIVVPVLPERLQSLTLVLMIYDQRLEVKKAEVFIDRG